MLPLAGWNQGRPKGRSRPRSSLQIRGSLPKSRRPAPRRWETWLQHGPRTEAVAGVGHKEWAKRDKSSASATLFREPGAMERVRSQRSAACTSTKDSARSQRSSPLSIPRVPLKLTGPQETQTFSRSSRASGSCTGSPTTLTIPGCRSGVPLKWSHTECVRRIQSPFSKDTEHTSYTTIHLRELPRLSALEPKWLRVKRGRKQEQSL